MASSLLYQAIAVVLSVGAASCAVLSVDTLKTVASGGVGREIDFAPRRLVNDLRGDMAALKNVGAFTAAGCGQFGRQDNQLRIAEYADPVQRSTDLGDPIAFQCLMERLDMARIELEQFLGSTLLDQYEIHYVQYPPGGKFARHVDDFKDDLAPKQPSRRCVSWILYLTEADWHPIEDGGLLRVFDQDHSYDILPQSGSLVLFDSLVVEHEVTPNLRRHRSCLVGWFHTPCLNYKNV